MSPALACVSLPTRERQDGARLYSKMNTKGGGGLQIAPDAYTHYSAWVKEYARSRGINSLAEQIAFCFIYGHTVNSPARCFFGTLEVVRYWTEAASETTARKYLSNLEKAGLIDKMTVIYKGRPRPAYRARVEEAETYRRNMQYTTTAEDEQGATATPQKLTPQILTPQKLTPQILDFDPSNFEGKNIYNNIKEKEDKEAHAQKGHESELVKAAMQPKEAPKTLHHFDPPTIEEVTAYLQGLANCPNKETAAEIAESYVNANEGMGWTRNGQTIKNWRPLARNYLASYIRNHHTRPQKPAQTAPKDKAAPDTPKESTEAQKAKIRAFFEAMKETQGEEAALEMVEKDVARRAPEIRQWWRAFTRKQEI